MPSKVPTDCSVLPLICWRPSSLGLLISEDERGWGLSCTSVPSGAGQSSTASSNPWVPAARQSKATACEASTATAPPAEPRVKIRYLTDDGAGGQRNNVEVFIDDVLVHNQTLPPGQDLAGTDFKAGNQRALTLPPVRVSSFFMLLAVENWGWASLPLRTEHVCLVLLLLLQFCPPPTAARWF